VIKLAPLNNGGANFLLSKGEAIAKPSPHFPHLFIIPSQVCGIMEPDSKEWRIAQTKKMGEGRMAWGGVAMQGIGWTPERKRRAEVAQVIVGVILFSLLMGLWAYLWVPLPIF
jgi:hypothetical protein